MDFNGSRDLISTLPESLIGHILSYIPTKEAARTSVLAKKWRYLFALSPNLDLDDSDYVNPPEVEMVPRRVIGSSEVIFLSKWRDVPTSFMDFVDRILALQGNSLVQKFSLKIVDGEEPVDPIRIFGWIHNVLKRGVSELDLNLDLEPDCTFPSEVFSSETLVMLKLMFGISPTIYVEDVYLPKVKILYIDAGNFDQHGVGLAKLLSGCHMLEDLILDDVSWYLWDFASVSVPTLERLWFSWQERDGNPKSVSFDTPNLVYLDFSDVVALEYPKVNFGSLAEAKIDLRMSLNTQALDQLNDEENNMVGDATNFIMALCNVKILYLSDYTLEVLTLCCETIPRFNNMTELTIESSTRVGWQSLPGLLKNSPKLETLIFEGLIHKATNRCGVMCVCKPYEKEEDESEEIFTCLSSSPVKVLEIMKFGETSNDINHRIEKQVEQVKHFLETMPNLEQLIIHYDTSVVEDLIEVARELRTVSNVALSKCSVELASDNLNVPSSIRMTLP